MDDEVLEGTVVAADAPLVQDVVPDERKRTAVWQHPRRQQIEYALRAGRTPRWVQLWLEDEYPDPEDADGDAPYNAEQARRWRLAASTVEQYVQRWLPEVDPGVDVINEDLENFVGRKLPAAAGDPWEVQVVEKGVDVAQELLARSLEADERMGMVTPVTMEANRRMIDAAVTSADLKGRLGFKGYEVVPDRVQVDQTSRELRVDLHGRVGAGGQIEAAEPAKVNLARQLMNARTPEERAEIMEQTRAALTAGDEDLGW
jgi:hypothetical protein